MKQEQKTLIIADDHPIFRLGLVNIVSQIPWVEVVGEAETGTSALAQLKHLQPDFISLDLEMPGMDGLSVLREIKELQLHTLPIILTSYDDEAYMDKALELGARAYVLKDDTGESMKACLNAVRSGIRYISPSFGHRPHISPAISDRNLLATLSKTERSVLLGVAALKTSREIAAELGVSHRTVQNHRTSICRKLGLKGAHQLVKFTMENPQS